MLVIGHLLRKSGVTATRLSVLASLGEILTDAGETINDEED
jgi:hypothetical protein